MGEVGPVAGSAGTLGILAAAGPLPTAVAEAALAAGRPVHIVAINGFAGEEIARFPNERVSLGEVGRILASFRRAGASELVIAGAMQRPNLLALRIDWGFLANLPTVLALTRGGDDSVLRRIVRFFEGHGFRVIGAGEVAPALLAPAGPIAGPDKAQAHDDAIAQAARLVAALGPFDIGQGVVAAGGRIIAVEGVRGTDAMLGDLALGGPLQGGAERGVLVKLPKPEQERRIDLPTIGAETVRRAAAAGLAGIAIAARATIVLERDALASEAAASGVFVVGIEPVGGTGPAAAAAAAEPSLLEVVARRAPTPADRVDMGVGRRLMDVMRGHGAGRAAIVSREHVLAVSGALPLSAMVTALGRPASWGRRTFTRRLGVLVIDGASPDAATAADDSLLDADLFRAVMASALAGVLFLGPIPEGERRSQLAAWANEAGVFLMAERPP